MSTERLPLIYLSGAIRDAYPEDIAWREVVIGERPIVFDQTLGQQVSEARVTVIACACDTL